MSLVAISGLGKVGEVCATCRMVTLSYLLSYFVMIMSEFYIGHEEIQLPLLHWIYFYNCDTLNCIAFSIASKLFSKIKYEILLANQ